MTSVDTGEQPSPSRPDGNPANSAALQDSQRDSVPKELRLWLNVLAVVLVLALAGLASAWWWVPYARQALGSSGGHGDNGHDSASGQDTKQNNDESSHAGHDHAADSHAGHDDANSLELSEQGRKNIGLTLVPVQLSNFKRTIPIPATLVGRAGRTEISVSAPMTGIVTRIYPIRGVAVLPGDPLFDLRLTHEDLVEKQSSLLKSLEELDVINREVTRLKEVTASGAIAGKRLLERQYEQQKVEAAIRAERQALLLHGLSDDQIQGIVDDRQLHQKLTLTAPPMSDGHSTHEHKELLQVAELLVRPGEHVATGSVLATLSDHCELYVEGKAFEHDATALNDAANAGVEVTAIVEGNGSGDHQVSGLKILHVENQVERESRALKFYVPLLNELVRNETTPEGHRFVGWRYRPGQRVELLVPVEQWKNRIVLPRESVVQEGPEFYVYQYVKGHFDRKPVHVEYRDQRSAVIESDGTLFPGDQVSAKGTHEIHLALKKKAGGGADPHAGHHH